MSVDGPPFAAAPRDLKSSIRLMVAAAKSAVGARACALFDVTPT